MVGVHKWAVDEAFVVVAERGLIGALLLAAKQRRRARLEGARPDESPERYL
jgi:hypothetical protein